MIDQCKVERTRRDAVESLWARRVNLLDKRRSFFELRLPAQTKSCQKNHALL